MKMTIKILMLSLAILAMNNVSASECDNSCKKQVIEKYFSFLGEIYKEGSSPEQVSTLFSLMSAGVKYEHIEYEADFDRAQWHQAFIANLERGVYAAPKNSVISVENYIYGKHHVAVEYSYGEVNKTGDWVPKGDQKLLALFGFDEEKLTLVREYW